MPRITAPIKRERLEHPFDEVEETHPAFGMINLSRRQGGGTLFGSALNNHPNLVSLTVSQASRRCGGNGSDRYFKKKTIVEVEMSEAQFAQLITTWNQGEGSPCTLKVIRDQGMIPQILSEEGSEVQRLRQEFEYKTKKCIEGFKASKGKLDEILEKKSINKGDKEEISAIFNSVSSWIGDGAPFLAEMFLEVSEKTVARAKIEIDAFAADIVRQTGIKTLQENVMKQIEANKD